MEVLFYEKKVSSLLSLYVCLIIILQVLTIVSVSAAESDVPENNYSSRIHVDENNFLNYFDLNGTATYEDNGLVTLTPDSRNQSGNATLKTRIDMTQSFTLEGEINLGNKSQLQNGADGIGFGFHSQITSSLGDGGGTMGIGSLLGGFGWKADTHFNQIAQRNLAKDPAEFGNEQARGKAFGSFMYNDVSTGTIVTHSDDSSGKSISEPYENTFKSIEISYDGSSKVMTVVYEGQSWIKNVSDWIIDNSLSFLISASTGSKTNLQQFKIKSLDYVPVGEIVTNYVDKFSGANIISGELFTGELGTTESPLKNLEKSILKLGYTYDSTIASDKAYYAEGTDSGTYSNNQLVVTYYYTKGQIQILKIDESTGEPISGAEFDIYDASDNIVDHIIIDTRGYGLSKFLPDGVYTIKETKAPEGYEISSEDYSTTVNYGKDGNSIINLTITNKKSTTEPSTTEPSTTEPSTTEPSTTEPSTTEPSTTEPSTTEPSTTEPSTTDSKKSMVVNGNDNNKKEHLKYLPKTGESASWLITAIGIVTIIGAGVFYIKKKS